MCEAAKKLTENERKAIWDFIYANSDVKTYGEESAKEWTKGWYDACLDKEDALEMMMRYVKKGFNKDRGPSPALIQEIVIYAGEM